MVTKQKHRKQKQRAPKVGRSLNDRNKGVVTHQSSRPCCFRNSDILIARVQAPPSTLLVRMRCKGIKNKKSRPKIAGRLNTV